jgi:hypothetical protein
MDTLKKHFSEMPFLLKLNYIFCALWGFIGTVLVMLPFANFEYEGRNVTLAEFWELGAGATFLLFGIFNLLCAYGIGFKKPWVKWLLTFYFFVFAAIDSIIYLRADLELYFTALFFMFLFGPYQLFKKTVKNYYSPV